MSFLTFRRYYLDQMLLSQKYYGKVLDVGGKKDNKRGVFRPALENVKSWEYLNIDVDTNPDYCCSADTIPVEDECFDMVLLNEVLEHLEDPKSVLQECYRVVKKGGMMIISMPFLYAIHADPYDFQRWTDVKLKQELQHAGFSYEHISVKPMGSLFAVIYDLLYVSVNNASNDSQSLKNKLLRKVFLPLLKQMFLFLDKRYSYKSKFITTGYYVTAQK